MWEIAMRRGCLCGLLVATAAFSAVAAEPRQRTKTQPIPPAVRTAMLRAYEANKPLMIDVGAVWCGWCKRFADDAANDPGMKRLVGQFVHVYIDAEKDVSSARYLRTRGLPTFVLFAPNGERLGGWTGYYPTPGQARTEFVRAYAAGIGPMTRAGRFQEAWWLLTRGVAMDPDGPHAERLGAQAAALVKAGKAKPDPKVKWTLIPELAKGYKPSAKR